MSGIGHNGPPVPFSRKRWALSIFAHPSEDKPFGAVAMAFRMYLAMDTHGNGIAISDQEFIRSCGVSDGSCRVFKKWLLDKGYIQLMARGQRGRCSTFAARIPAASAAIVDAQAAAIAGISAPDYRQPSPVIENQLPATTAANQQIAAANAGIPEIAADAAGNPPRARTRKESPSGINISNNNKLLQPPPEQDAARGGGGYDPEFQELNGTAIQLVKFIAQAANVDEKTSRQMLKNNISIFGRDAMMEAFVSCQAEMATGLVANPYKYLIGVAKKAKIERDRPERPSKRRGVDPETLKAQNEMLRREYGFDKE